LTSSEPINHLPQDDGEVVGDFPAEFRRQASPDVAGFDRHAFSLSVATAIRSSSAWRLSLVGATCVLGECRLVTRIERIKGMSGRYSTWAKPGCGFLWSPPTTETAVHGEGVEDP
jgi:hypothetical protein